MSLITFRELDYVVRRQKFIVTVLERKSKNITFLMYKIPMYHVHQYGKGNEFYSQSTFLFFAGQYLGANSPGANSLPLVLSV